MTTLVGIKAGNGKGGVVLGSDLSRTQTQWQPQGDVAYRHQTRSEGQKIHVDNAGEVALCMSGVFDQKYVDFLSAVLAGDINVRERIEQGSFPELAELNFSRWNRQVPNTELMNGLLIATRYGGNPELYTAFPLGALEPRASVSIGSGSGFASNYVTKQGKLIPRGISLEEGIDLTVGALDEAAQDIHTGGLDLVVVQPERIQSFGPQIAQAISSARNSAIGSIKKSLA